MQIVKLLCGTVLVYLFGNFLLSGYRIITDPGFRETLEMAPETDGTVYGILFIIIGLLGVLGGLLLIRKTMKRKS